jgi:cytochrome c oxidase cbb3-type subunit 4
MNLESVDINVIRAVVLILLILGFLSLIAWAWSRNRKEAFHEASMLPLEEDDGQVPKDDSKKARAKE